MKERPATIALAKLLLASGEGEGADAAESGPPS